MFVALKRWVAAREWSNKGFTLIEMSIVLVIIGLIVGGILKGQEIIGSARSKAVVNEMNSVRSAVNTYYDRYRALPGDDPNAVTRLDGRLVNGDGNGVVGNNAGATAGAMRTYGAANQGENYQFFKAMVAAGLLGGADMNGVVQTANTFGVGSSLPTAPITGSGVTVVYGKHEGDGLGDATGVSAHWLRVHKNAAAPTPAFTPRELANIDSQADDGSPNEGSIRGDISGTCNTAGQLPAAVYLVSDDIGCIGFFFATP